MKKLAIRLLLYSSWRHSSEAIKIYTKFDEIFSKALDSQSTTIGKQVADDGNDQIDKLIKGVKESAEKLKDTHVFYDHEGHEEVV